MIHRHLDFVPPKGSQILWRYMDLSKLRSMLENRELYFAPAARMEDPFEGAYPEGNSNFGWLELLPERRAQAKANFDAARKYFKSHKSEVFLSCWIMNDTESKAMWDLYVKGSGIAIRTTAAKLSASLYLEPNPIYFGQINYINFKTQAIPTPYGMTVFTPFLFKGNEWSHEREARLVMWDRGVLPSEPVRLVNGADTMIFPIDQSPNPPLNCRARIDPHLLINAIVMCPKASQELLHETRELLEAHRLQSLLVQSRLDESPNWG